MSKKQRSSCSPLTSTSLSRRKSQGQDNHTGGRVDQGPRCPDHFLDRLWFGGLAGRISKSAFASEALPAGGLGRSDQRAAWVARPLRPRPRRPMSSAYGARSGEEHYRGAFGWQTNLILTDAPMTKLLKTQHEITALRRKRA
jgi:hypothetical protein